MKNLVRLLRPHHWTKNAFCLAGAIFSGHYLEAGAIRDALLTAASFCLASSAVYVLNDFVDRDRDRRHPKKASRPLASGAVSPAAAGVLALLLLAGSLLLTAPLDARVLGTVLAYLGLNVLYSLGLKHVPMVDVLSIALSFELRMLAGVYAVGARPTPWIALCTFFLALFLALSKRRAEKAALAGAAEDPRPVLRHYPLAFLDVAVVGSGLTALMCYALFTTTSGKNPSHAVGIPVIAFALMHYARRLMQGELGEEPERSVLKDPAIFASIALWIGLYLWVERSGVRLFAGP